MAYFWHPDLRQTGEYGIGKVMRTQKLLVLCLGIFIVSSPLVAAPPSGDEGLYVRRIVELWKDGDYDLAKRQMRQFLEQYPKSPFRDRLMLIAGDQEYREENYVEALSFYEQIEGPQLREQLFDRYVDSLYRAKEYERLLEALQGHLPPQQQNELTPLEAVHLYQYAEALAHVQKHKEAIAIYERLYATPLGNQAKLAAAQSYTATDRPEEAVAFYFALCEAMPEKREDMLLRAAQVQVAYDPEGAAATLGKLQGQATAAGCFSQVFLLFQGQRYQELWDRRDSLVNAVPDNQRELLDFFLGRAAFALGNYQGAIDRLRPLLAEGALATESDANERTILALLATSAQKLKNTEQAAEWIKEYQDKYPSDPTLQRLLLSQSEVLRGARQMEKALDIVDVVAGQATASEEKERAAFQRIGLLYDLGRWQECHLAAADFLATFPTSTYKICVDKAIAQATGKQLEDPTLTKEARAKLQEQLASELNTLLRAPRALTQVEKPVYLLQLARVEYTRGNLPASKAIAQQFVTDYPRDKQLYQAHLLLAYSAYEGGSDLQTFLRHAEAALQLNPNQPDADGVHLNLYAAYISLAKDGDEKVNGEGGNFSKAADHLWIVLKNGRTTVQPESLVWLAKFYNQVVRGQGVDLPIEPMTTPRQRELAERAITALQAAVQGGYRLSDKLDDAILLSQLYGRLGETTKRQQLLEEVIAHPQPDTPSNRVQLERARLSLAHLYEDDGNQAKAISLYQELLASPVDADAPTRSLAQLHLACLRYAMLEPQQRTDSNLDVVAALSELQTLQSRRRAVTEPVHLEAAWERAHILADIAPAETHNAVLLKNLKEVKRDIVGEEDIVSRDYHAARKQSPDCDLLYQAYLILFDAKIAQVEAEEAAKRKHVAEQRSKEQAAKTLYGTLLQGDFAVSKYLVAKAQSGLNEMKAAH